MEDPKVNAAIKKLMYRFATDPLYFVEYGIGVANAERDDTFVRAHQKDLLKKVKTLYMSKVKKVGKQKLSSQEKAVVDKLGISLRSGQGVGKTTAVAWILIWFICTHKNALMPCIAPKAQQLKLTLWKEVRVWLDFMQKNGHPLFRDKLVVQTDKIYNKDGGDQGKEKWAAVAKTTQQTSDEFQQGVGLQGDHGKHMLIAVEEAPGIPDAAFETFEGTMTDPINFMIMIFNPNKPHGYAYDTHHKYKENWVCLHWNKEECEGIDQSKVQLQEEKWGRDSNLYRIRVLGEFPLEDADTFIPLYLIENMFDDDVEPEESAPLIYGVDPAGGKGRDETVIVERRGNVIGPIHSFKSLDTMQIADWIARHCEEEVPQAIVVDSNGLGDGLYNRLRQLRLPVYGINPRANPRQKEKFVDTRDELIYGLKDPIFRGGLRINLNDPLTPKERAKKLRANIIEEMCILSFDTDSSGRMKFIKKKEMRKRLGRSPDTLDAICLSLYFRDRVFQRKKAKDHQYRHRPQRTSNDSWMV